LKIIYSAMLIINVFTMYFEYICTLGTYPAGKSEKGTYVDEEGERKRFTQGYMRLVHEKETSEKPSPCTPIHNLYSGILRFELMDSVGIIFILGASLRL
jgi:hypothetical protein